MKRKPATSKVVSIDSARGFSTDPPPPAAALTRRHALALLLGIATTTARKPERKERAA